MGIQYKQFCGLKCTVQPSHGSNYTVSRREGCVVSVLERRSKVDSLVYGVHHGFSGNFWKMAIKGF